MRPWLRLYTEMLNDPKVQRLDGETFKTFINLLLLSNQEGLGGDLPDQDDVAFVLRVPANVLAGQLETLRDRGLIDGMHIHGWENRQYESDSDPTAKDRKRRQRDREKGARDAGQPDEKESRVTVTKESRVTEKSESQNVTRTDTDTDRDTENKSITGPAVAEPAVEKARTVDQVEEGIYQAMLSAQGGRFANYPRERNCAKSCAKQIRSLSPDHPEAYAQTILAAFAELIASGERFWREQPFTPSGLSPLIGRIHALQVQKPDLSRLAVSL